MSLGTTSGIMLPDLPERLRVNVALLLASFGKNNKMTSLLCDIIEKELHEFAAPVPRAHVADFSYYRRLVLQAKWLMSIA